jgi:hypothetical protein
MATAIKNVPEGSGLCNGGHVPPITPANTVGTLVDVVYMFSTLYVKDEVVMATMEAGSSKGFALRIRSPRFIKYVAWMHWKLTDKVANVSKIEKAIEIAENYVLTRAGVYL